MGIILIGQDLEVLFETLIICVYRRIWIDAAYDLTQINFFLNSLSLIHIALIFDFFGRIKIIWVSILLHLWLISWLVSMICSKTSLLLLYWSAIVIHIISCSVNEVTLWPDMIIFLALFTKIKLARYFLSIIIYLRSILIELISHLIYIFCIHRFHHIYLFLNLFHWWGFSLEFTRCFIYWSTIAILLWASMLIVTIILIVLFIFVWLAHDAFEIIFV